MSRMMDPALLSPVRWQARHAALKAHGVPDTDPRIIEIHAALSWWRCRRVIDAEREQLAPEHIPALADMLRHAHQAVSASSPLCDADRSSPKRPIVEPLAARMAELPRPLAVRQEVDDVADATHELVSTVVGMLAESRHSDHAVNARIARTVADLAQRPREPQINDDMLTSGRWAAVLIKHVAPHSEDFATFLGRALPPNHPHLRGPSASDRLAAALRVR